MQDDHYPGYPYYLCYASCLDAIAMSRYPPLVYQAYQIAMKQPLTFFTLPSKPLFCYVTACSAPLIALLVAGAVAVCSMLGHGYLGISQYLLFLINAHIYLVKGGRL